VSGPGAAAARFRDLGEGGLSVELGEGIDARVNTRVHQLAAEARRQLAGLALELVPAYRSLLFLFDPLQVGRRELRRLIESILQTLPNPPPPLQGRTVEIPVCYGAAHGPDLAAVAAHAGLSEAEAIALHAGATYRVCLLGFTPGFPYLGGMPERLALPRLTTPRPRVPAGSVGIAAAQTGIYPLESPGGWRLIGRTALRLFDPGAARPFLLSPGDAVRFVPIDEEQLGALQGAAGSGP
jgi:KipI family sensor histidine kinase inhibitor